MAKSKHNKKSSNKKSSNWANRQNRDQYVKQARSQGLRARAVFKLEQIDKKYRLIKPNSAVVDLGSAPGSWSQYAATRLAQGKQLIAVDLLEMAKIDQVKFIHGDFTDTAIQGEIRNYFIDSGVDLVLSDMAPNITGIRITDQANAEALQESILSFCESALNLNGNLLTKIFEGEVAGLIKKRIKTRFKDVQTIKPDASRSQSREVYVLARGFQS